MDIKEANDNLIMLKYFIEEEKGENWKEYTEAIKTLLNELELKDKVIDEMAKEILRLDIVKSNLEYDHARIWESEKGIKEYYSRKVKENGN